MARSGWEAAVTEYVGPGPQSYSCDSPPYRSEFIKQLPYKVETVRVMRPLPMGPRVAWCLLLKKKPLTHVLCGLQARQVLAPQRGQCQRAFATAVAPELLTH